MSLRNTIICSSNKTVNGGAVTVMCTYNTTMYSGYSVCIQNEIQFSPSRCALSKECGSILTITGSVDGKHEVYVNPIWKGPPPMGILESPYRETYILTQVLVTHPTSTMSKFKKFE